MPKDSYVFKVSNCSFCYQNWVQIVKDNEALKLYFYCDSCCLAWDSFNDLSKSDLSYLKIGGGSSSPSYSEIKLHGWDKYLLESKTLLGEFIGIGFVFDSQKHDLKNSLKKLIFYLSSNKALIKEIITTSDKNGQSLIGKKILHNNDVEIYDSIDDVNNLNIIVEYNLLGISNIDFTIRIKKDDSYFGFLLDIPYIDIRECMADVAGVIRVTDQIEEFIKRIYSVVKFDDAICDMEADIKYHPQVLKLLLHENLYSVIVIPDDIGLLNVFKSNRHINLIDVRQIT